MSKIPKLPKGQSRPASPEPSPNSLNDNNTPNMQVLHPRSSSLSRASSVRRSFIRAPKPRGLPPSSTPPQKSGSPPRGLPPSSTPPQKSGSPPPAAVGSSPAKRLPPSGLPTSMVTPPRTGLPPKGIPSASVPIPTASLPPSGLPTLGGASKNDSPNSKMLSPNPNDSDHKLSSPSSRKSSFSRNSPLRTSRIPRKNSLPPQPNTSTDSSQEAAESVSSDQSDDMAGSITSLDGSSRNSSPIPSNISKIPTVNGSAISTSSRRCEILKSRRLKYPALWNMGAPNYFSERDDMSGNTSLEMLRLGVEELETRVTSLECQMGIQNTELLYNSDDEDKSPQDPEEAYLHELTDPTRTSTPTISSLLGSYSYLKPPLHTSPSTSLSNLRSPTTSMSNLRSPTSSLSNLRCPSASLSNLRSPTGSMNNIHNSSTSMGTSMVSLLKRPESPCRSLSLSQTQSPDKSSLYCNESPTTYQKTSTAGIKPLSFQRFLSPWADYSEQIDRILNFRKVH